MLVGADHVRSSFAESADTSRFVTAPGTASSLVIVICASRPCAWRVYRELGEVVLATIPSSIVSLLSTAASFVIVTVRFCVFCVDGPNVTDFVDMLKSVSSVAEPPLSTSMVNVVDSFGRWSTVTGTLSVPPATFSATVAVYFAVAAALDPIAIRPSVREMVTFATALPADQPVALVPSCTAKHSPPPTRSSPLSASGYRNSSTSVPSRNVYDVGAFWPMSSAVASVSPSHTPVGTLVPSSRVIVSASPPTGAASESMMPIGTRVPGASTHPAWVNP